MVDAATLRRLALALPEVTDGGSEARFAFEVGGKAIAWSFMERVRPKAPRAPRLDILAVRCDLTRKEMLIAAASDRFFEDDHYRGYPAVLVRLDAIRADELEGLLADAWKLVASKTLAKRCGR